MTIHNFLSALEERAIISQAEEISRSHDSMHIAYSCKHKTNKVSLEAESSRIYCIMMYIVNDRLL